ncbi:MAG TPA: hypothetical protein VIG25_01470 [Pyrinomonadaceae bacterium]|jgi:hypothetical protein
MQRRFFAVLSGIILLVAFAMVLSARNHRASRSSNAITVTSHTRGDEVLTAEILNNQVRIRLKNNHKDTITAYAIRLSGTTITEDFAYSEVHIGIEPGDTLQRDFPVTPAKGSELPTLSLLAVLLKDGTEDGDSKVAQQIKDQRLGQKVQFIRTLRILEKEGQLPKDLGMLKSDILAALDTGESETRIILKELQPASRTDAKLSDDFRNGLQWGREDMLRSFEDIERQPPESRERAFLELKDRINKVYPKL